ncbi:MAG: Ivy family c-type lysozyme inhibitor [Methylovirgula sp.]
MKKTAVLVSLAAAFFAGASVAFAQATGAYLFDVMKEPQFQKAYAAMLTGATHLPSWLREITGKGNYVATPETPATVGGIPYRLFHACKAHDCAGHELEVMFSPDAAKAYGLLIDGDKPRRWFGAPDADQQTALAKAIEE